MTAVDTLCEITERYWLMPEHAWVQWLDNDRPGQEFERLPEEVKEKLRGLRSDDLARLRPGDPEKLAGYCQYRAEWARDYRRRHPK